MADPRQENADRPETGAARGGKLAGEVERARTPRTPLLALTGVWLTVALAVALLLAVVALTRYVV
ncbi:MAG: hypothetical protein M3310_05120 [Actinomycetota bacterium]|nr:hypothetical protein [Actinomycetota bacterium]